MAQHEILTHVQAILDGTNYTVWAQSMRSFLKGRKLWLYVTGARARYSASVLDRATTVRFLLRQEIREVPSRKQ
jgi:hypothetical protein